MLNDYVFTRCTANKVFNKTFWKLPKIRSCTGRETKPSRIGSCTCDMAYTIVKIDYSFVGSDAVHQSNVRASAHDKNIYELIYGKHMIAKMICE